VFGASIDISSEQRPQDAQTLRGLASNLIDIPPVVVPQGLDREGPYSEILVPEIFPPGSIMLFATHMQELDAEMDAFCTSGSNEAFNDLDLVDLNVVLYRADGEERDTTRNEFGVYHVPGIGDLAYCGLEGWMHPLRHIIKYDDLGHPLCAHLREGTWALDYVYARLER
jgi:glycogen debranching enzyme